MPEEYLNVSLSLIWKYYIGKRPRVKSYNICNTLSKSSEKGWDIDQGTAFAYDVLNVRDPGFHPQY